MWILGGQYDCGDLGFVVYFGEEECDQGGEEGVVFFQFGFFVVEFVWYQCLQGDGDEGGGEDLIEGGF